jgi:hypothetical protein
MDEKMISVKSTLCILALFCVINRASSDEHLKAKSANATDFINKNSTRGEFGKRTETKPIDLEKRQNIATFQGGYFNGGNFGKRTETKPPGHAMIVSTNKTPLAVITTTIKTPVAGVTTSKTPVAIVTTIATPVAGFTTIATPSACPGHGSVISDAIHLTAIRNNCVLMGIVVSNNLPVVPVGGKFYIGGSFSGGNFGKRQFSSLKKRENAKRYINEPIDLEKRQNIATFQGGYFNGGNFGKRTETSKRYDFRILKQKRQSFASIEGGYFKGASPANCLGCWTVAEFGPNGK